MIAHLENKENNTIQRIQNNWVVNFASKGVVVTIGASLLLLIIRWKQLPPLVPLWYSLPWGMDQLASPFWLFILPLSSAVIFAINTMVAIYIVADYLIFIQLTFLTSLLVSLLSFISLMKILSLVT